MGIMNRGSIKKWHSAAFGPNTRAMNPMECHETVIALENDLKDKIEKARKDTAFKFLSFLRSQINEYRTHNHRIWISAGMGTACIRINDDYINDIPERGTLNLILHEMDQIIESSYDWASYLDGETLN